MSYVLIRDRRGDFWLTKDGVTLVDYEGDMDSDTMLYARQIDTGRAVELSEHVAEGLIVHYRHVARIGEDDTGDYETWKRLARNRWEQIMGPDT